MLVLTSSEFDDPAPDAANVRYAGPVLEDIPADAALDLPPGDDPLVVVGLSSSYMDQSALLVRIAQALSTLPVRGVVTTGPAIDPADIPAAPTSSWCVRRRTASSSRRPISWSPTPATAR